MQGDSVILMRFSQCLRGQVSLRGKTTVERAAFIKTLEVLIF